MTKVEYYIRLVIVIALSESSVENEYKFLPDTKFETQETDVDEQRWAIIDDEIAAREEEFNRRRRQILMITRPSNNNKQAEKEERNKNSCPSKCICQVPEQVHCTFRFMTHIPTQLPENIEKLNIGFNKISTLTSNSIEKYNKTLRHLYLHSNDIRSLSNNGFMKMGEIKVLRLSWNKITGIRKTALHGLSKVERLYLDNNRLTFIHPLALRGLVNLKLLQLSGNRLSRLHQNVFVTLEFQKFFRYSSIQYLYLAENRFKNLHPHIFDYLQQLKYIYLHGNSWDCTCETKWMKMWMENSKKYRCKSATQRARSSGEECPLCGSPVNLEGKRIMAVPTENFICQAPKLDTRDNSTHVYDYDMENINWNNEIALFRFSDFYSVRMNIRLDNHRRSLLHASCNLTRVPVTSVTAHKTDSHYTASFEAQMQCFIEYPEDLDDLHKILNPYFDREMHLRLVQRKNNKNNENQPQYSVTVSDINEGKKLQLTGAGVYSSTKFMRAPISSIIFESGSVDSETRSVHATFKTSFTHSQSLLVGTESKRPWALIKQPDPTRVNVAIALERTTTTIKCRAVGQPEVEISWVTPYGQSVKSGARAGKYYVSRSGRLIIRRTDKADSGFYRCIATVPETAKSNLTSFPSSAVAEISVLRLHVFAKTADAVSLLASSARAIEMQTVEEGDNWLSRCNVQGFPTFVQGWITPQNELVLNAGKTHGLIVSGNGRITTSNFTKSDQGLYRCVAANIAGKMDRFVYAGIRSNDGQFMQTIDQVNLETETSIHQGAQPDEISVSISDDVAIIHIPSDTIGEQTTKLEPEITKPQFDPGLSTLYTVAPGSSVALDCKASGNPDPTYVWYFSNKTLESAIVNGKVLLVGSTLVIKAAEEEFAGSYRCVAENSVGAIAKTVQLSIDKRTATESPEIPDASDTRHPTKNDSISLRKTKLEQPATIYYEDDQILATLDKTYTPEDTENESSVNLDEGEPGIFSSKYSKFLSTPASYKNIPVVVRPRTRANRKEAFVLKPSTTKAPTRKLHSDDTVQQFTKPTLFTTLRQNHAKKILTALSNVEKVIKEQKKTTPSSIVDVIAPTVDPAVQIAKNSPENRRRKLEYSRNFKYDLDATAKKESLLENDAKLLNASYSKDRPLSRTNRPLHNSFDSLMLAAFVNKTIRTVDISSIENDTYNQTLQTPATTVQNSLQTSRTRTAYTQTYRTPYSTVQSSLQTSRTRTAYTQTLQTPAATIPSSLETSRTRPAYTRGGYRYEPAGKFSQRMFKSTHTLFKNSGENVVLSCLPSNREYNPMHRWTFVWYLPLGMILRRPHQIFSSDYRQFVYFNGSLSLRNLKSKDAGTYSCMGSERGPGVFVEYQSRITLHVRSRPPRILNSLRGYVNTPSGGSVTIPCETEGNPEPTVTWRLPKGKTIEAGKWIGGIIVHKNGALDLPNIRPEDGGYYICTASNTAGQSVRSVFVQITSYPPRFTGSRNLAVRVKTGTRARLVCPAVGHPKPAFVWLSPNDDEIRENHAIFKGNSHQAKYAGMSGGVLYVNDAHQDDSGMYHCIATNKHGQLVLSTRLIVFR